MIQRIQSLWLLLAFLLQISLFVLPLYSAKSIVPGQKNVGAVLKVYSIEKTGAAKTAGKETRIIIFPLVINSLLSALVLLTIFLYKNRQRQYQISRFLILLDLGLITTIVFALDDFKKIFPLNDFTFHYNYPVAFPVITILLIFLAGRGIMRDEKLVHSSDRIR